LDRQSQNSPSANIIDSHGVGGGGNSYNRGQFSDKLSSDVLKGDAEMTVCEGREGLPMIIPAVRRDGTGTTRINIANTENDNALQDRFKKMAQDSMNDNVPNYARSGYKNTTRNCPICKGDGSVRGSECPKCKGQGIISVY